jgi:hypothetical protein
MPAIFWQRPAETPESRRTKPDPNLSGFGLTHLRVRCMPHLIRFQFLLAY